VTGRTTATNWTRLKYAGAGLFSFEEDIDNPANFISLIQRCEAAAERAVAVPTYEFEDGKLVGPSALTALGGELSTPNLDEWFADHRYVAPGAHRLGPGRRLSRWKEVIDEPSTDRSGIGMSDTTAPA
jgi:hypothetical protein